MRDTSRIVAGMACGAAVGGLAVYLVLTPDGRQTLLRVNSALEDLSARLHECRRTLRQAQRAWREARAVAEDVQTVVAGRELAVPR